MSKVLLLLAALIGLAACDVESEEKRARYFNGSDAEKMLNRAIDNDDPVGVSEAIEQGVDPDVKGLLGIGSGSVLTFQQLIPSIDRALAAFETW